MIAIELENVTLQHPDGHVALRDFSCRFAPGRSVALLGANGAGKSSLIRAVVGLMPLAAGRLVVDGIALEHKTVPAIRRKVGVVFQHPDDQLFAARVADDIAFGPRNLGLPPAEVDARVAEAAAEFGLRELLARSPQRLSDGEKRRAALAGVLAMRPEALLFDEPTAQLDPRGRREFGAVLDRLKQTRIVATHDLGFARQHCTQVLILRRGERAAYGDAATLLADEALLRQCDLA